MKHILNDLSEQEKNSIREQHAKGGMKVMNENFSKLLNSKLGDVKPMVNEQSIINIGGDETDPKKTDCRTNPYWKQLESKLLSMGFSKSERHVVKKAGTINFGGYPNVDFYECRMTHISGVEVNYPFYAPDYTGDYYPELVDVDVDGMPVELDEKSSCVGSPLGEDIPRLKVRCVDYNAKLISSLLKK